MQEDTIKICKNCHKEFPCGCEDQDYIDMVRWVYDLMKKLNPMG